MPSQFVLQLSCLKKKNYVTFLLLEAVVIPGPYKSAITHKNIKEHMAYIEGETVAHVLKII